MSGRSTVSVTASSRRRCATAWICSIGWASGAMPVVSTACICSTRPKNSLSWPSVCSASASAISSRARCAMRFTSVRVRAMRSPENKAAQPRGKRRCGGGWRVQSHPQKSGTKREKYRPFRFKYPEIIRYHYAFDPNPVSLFPHRFAPLRQAVRASCGPR
ncbi:protein of unknown function [Burkholderia multivorans]